MIVIDEERIFDEIERRQPASVSLNGPEGIIAGVQNTAVKITERFGIPAYVIADATWGTCDLNAKGAEVLGAGIHFNIGHTVNTESPDGTTILVNAFDDVGFGSVAKKCADMLAGRTVGLVTDSQHLRQVEPVRSILEDCGVKVMIGSGKGQLNDGQVFGCEFYPQQS